jgi:hypothetical protein
LERQAFFKKHKTMYEYHNDKLSIPASILYDDLEIIAYNTYRSWCDRGKLVRTKEGRGKGNEAFVSYYDIAEKWVQNAVKAYLGDPKKVVSKNHLEDLLIPDHNAIQFFASHRKPDGKALEPDKQREKATTAMILNAIETLFKTNSHIIRKSKKMEVWQNITDAVNDLAIRKREDGSQKWVFNLPGNQRSLQRKYKKYLNYRYQALIHRNEGSQNARVVTADIESLIISLHCIPNKPYMATTHDLYMQFLGGAIEVVNIETGELFNKEDFYKDDQPIEISEATVWNYLKKPQNQLIIAKKRNGAYDFSHKQRPHVNRTAPQFSMSKISLDDRDIYHTKITNTGEKVMSYYAFDDMSTAMIGISHSKTKDNQLFLDCIKNMFQFTTSKGLGVPMQMEVEHHLVKNFKDGLMLAGNVFPFVRWCNPTNSQEKYAERLIHTKKYGVEKMNNQNVGRFYARLDSNRVTLQKIFDEKNDTYKEAKATYKQIIANELEEQIQYNNQLHPNQKQYEGMTRMDVFLHHVNPNLPEFNKSHLAKYIGEQTSTSIRRNQYVTVQHGKYQLPSAETISLLAPNNFKVEAYYIPTENNSVDEVFIYQNNQFIAACKPVPTFNRANAEWTEKDEQGYTEATKYISQFDKMVKQDTAEKLQRVSIIKTAAIPKTDAEPELVETLEENEEYQFEAVDEASEYNRAINEL